MGHICFYLFILCATSSPPFLPQSPPHQCCAGAGSVLNILLHRFWDDVHFHVPSPAVTLHVCHTIHAGQSRLFAKKIPRLATLYKHDLNVSLTSHVCWVRELKHLTSLIFLYQSLPISLLVLIKYHASL